MRFPDVDTILGPEMKSTGEVMGLDTMFGMAFVKSQIAASQHLPQHGTIFISVKDADKPLIVSAIKRLVELKFNLIGTEGTAKFFRQQGFNIERVYKVGEGRPDVVDLMKNNEIALVINTPSGKKPRQDEIKIRINAYAHGIPIVTTVRGVFAAVDGIEALIKGKLNVKSIHEYHTELQMC
jgi:carbamoyl-phosphate synthase large subunit